MILGVRAQGNCSEIPGEDRVRPLCEEGREEGDDRRARAVIGRVQRGAASGPNGRRGEELGLGERGSAG